MKIKFCGIRRYEDIEYVNKIKPDYIGFIMAEGYKRTVTAEQAKNLISNLIFPVKTAGVFVNEPLENIKEYDFLDVIQLHGDENKDYITELKKYFNDTEIWKAVRVKNTSDIENADNLGADKLLLDSFTENQYGGTGKTADLNVIKTASIKTPFFLAGGLNEENIKEAIETIKPYGVDISSGIETDGFKDYEKMKRIAEIIRSK